MLGDIVGYVLIKKDAECQYAVMSKPEELQGKILRALEFNDNTSTALIINKESNAMDSIDYDDIHWKFKCIEVNGVILPPEDNVITNIMMSDIRLTRKGGYNNDIKHMVIAASLHKQKFYDGFLFEKQ